MFAVKQEKFEGPLDLLLALIEERKLSINEISLSEVTNQYLEYIKSFENFPFSDAAIFLTVASTLILIKSRSLLPLFQLSREEEENINELEKRLEIYKRVRHISKYIQEIFGKNILFTHPAFSGVPRVFSPPLNLSCALLGDTVNEILATLPQKDTVLPEKIVEKVITVEEKISELKKRFEKSFEATFQDLKTESKVELIVSFLALLELIRRGFLWVEQKELFGDINISSFSQK